MVFLNDHHEHIRHEMRFAHLAEFSLLWNSREIFNQFQTVQHHVLACPGASFYDFSSTFGRRYFQPDRKEINLSAR